MAMTQATFDDDITVTSSSETPEEIQAALALSVPDDDATAAAPAEDVAPVDAAPVAPAPKKRQSFQERIDELTAERRKAERLAADKDADLARLRAELDAARRPSPQQTREPEPARVTAPPASTFPDYATWAEKNGHGSYEDYLDARTEHRLEQRERQQAEQARVVSLQRAEAERVSRRAQDFTERMQQGLEADPSAVERIPPQVLHSRPLSVLSADDRRAGNFTFANVAAEAMFRAEHPVALGQFLAANPDHVQRLATLPLEDCLEAFARLDGRLAAASTGTASGRISPPSAAPAPISPVTGRSAAMAPDEGSDDEPVDAHIARENAREKRSRARR